jgi:AraC family transcriptional regulator
LAKIAVELEQALAQRRAYGTRGQTTDRVLAKGNGWDVADVMCTCGPQDRPFEEQHTRFSIAIVAAGSFQYKSGRGHELMTPGSLLLGNPQQSFECAHAHGSGDRCLSVKYAPEFFARIATDLKVPRTARNFRAMRVPPLREMSRLVTAGCGALEGSTQIAWEEFAVELAAKTLDVSSDSAPSTTGFPRSTVARVSRSLRQIELCTEENLSLAVLAREAGLSPYHFLRCFEALTGVTPHQYVLRTRLRRAAMRVANEATAILEIALDSGFGDISNFNRAFRMEYGVSPRRYRKAISGAKKESTAGDA